VPRTVIFPALILAAGLAFSSQMSSAKPEYTRKTKLECDYCHPPNARTLNEAGEYYRTHHYKMEGYKPKEEEKKENKAKDKSQEKPQAKHA
jgi:hypothetical protein